MQLSGKSDPTSWTGIPFFMPSQQDQQPEEAALPQWPAPSSAVMEDRWLFRRTILTETRDHRRIHPHNGMSDTGRNILDVLFDRERRGGRALTLQQKRSGKRSGSPGDRSPATVVESPVSTARNTMYEGDDDNGAENPVESSESSASPLTESETDKMTLRRVTYPLRVDHELRTFAEYSCAVKYHSSFLHHLGGDDDLDEDGRRPASSKAVSTISVAFSPDALTMASTHGDHTVKISCCNTGRLLQSLEGHPRTPWTVKYHPYDSERIASGCLGHQVRLWNWVDKVCLQMVRLDFAIISLSFHPSGTLMAVANGTRLHFWGINDRPDKRRSVNNDDQLQAPPVQRSTMLTEIDQRHMLRCVHFPPNGRTLIIGGVNPSSDDPRRRNRGGIGGGGMSFYLRMWDFDLAAALQPNGEPVGIGGVRRGISNPQTFVPRALLYNDGGFDVSPDGKTLCACAEYWLPDGVDNAMELLHREDRLYEDESTDSATRPSQSSNNASLSLAETHSAVSAALAKLKGITREANHASLPRGRSPVPSSLSQNPTVPGTPTAPSREHSGPTLDFIPRTPPIPRDQNPRLSPPSPPGRRYAGGLGEGREARNAGESSTSEGRETRGLSTPPPPPPPPAPPAPGGLASRPPHPLSVISSTANYSEVAYRNGRYVPHVVTISLDTTPIPLELEKLPRGKSLGAVARGYRPRLGQLLEACPLDAAKASAVTCVKFSPSTDFCLIGYGVREPMVEGSGNFHPVTALYRIRGGMNHVSTMLSGDDDVNIARFHPDSGHGFVYGTKQGRVRVLGPRPWNFYHC